MSDLFDVVHAQRACRSFASTPLPDDVVARVLDAATFAPSAENRQPWVFVVVRDDAARARIHDLTARAWEGGGRDFAARRLEPDLMADVEHGIAGGGYRAAPVLVVVAADGTRRTRRRCRRRSSRRCRTCASPRRRWAWARRSRR